MPSQKHWKLAFAVVASLGSLLYGATAAGRRFLADNHDAVDAMTLRTRHAARTAAKMALPPTVRHAMHAVKHALMARCTGWNASEARRVATLLEHAAQEIAAGAVRAHQCREYTAALVGRL